jgi:hypothetical protein
MTRGRGLDYLPCEIEALAFLATETMLDNWHSFFGSPEPADDLWISNAELAQEWLFAHRLEQQRNKACGMLFLRGLVERRRFPGEGGGWFYRLLPVVTGDARANP